MQPPIRLIIADDHAVFRQGLKSLFATYSRFKIVAEVDRSSELERTLMSTPCEVVLLDLQMDQWVMEKIQWLARHALVVVLTASESAEDATSAFRLGARAVVQKRFALESLIAAIQTVMEGLVWLPPTTPTEMEGRAGQFTKSPLTNRELAVVRCAAQGLRNAEVARQLSITEGTVKIQLNRIFHKLGLRDRVELAQYAFRNGLVKVRSRD
jgi:two-component system, NarL family, response regulator